MKKLLRNYFILIVVAASIVAGYHSVGNTSLGTGEQFNGIYFWRTTFNINDKEKDFIRENNINRLYLRLFDVDNVLQNGYSTPFPIATLIFPDSATTAQTTSLVQEIVPVCFITQQAIMVMRYNEHNYAEKIVRRMLNMCSYHGFRNKVNEVQIDCDWTQQTQECFFNLLKEIKSLLAAEGISLSVTIRLHQLRLTPPPADNGVLMLYNTGSIKNPDTKNSILSFADAYQYLTNSAVKKYGIPIDYALPVFSWGVWFRDNRYMGILHQTDYSNSEYYTMIDNTHYQVRQPHFIEERLLQKGDIIRFEKSDYKTIMQVKARLPFQNGTPSVILYHLDNNKLQEYETTQITNMYRRSTWF